MLARPDRPADALQLLPDRRRQRRPEPRVHEPAGRLDGPRDASRSRPATGCSTRTRSSSDECAASGRSIQKTALRMVMTGPEPARDRCPVRRRDEHTRTASSRSSSSTSQPGPRATAWPATCCAWTRSSRACGSSTSACTRCRTARSWPSCRGCCAHARVGRTPRSRGPAASSSTYAVSDGTDQPFRMRIHDPSFIHLQAVGLMMPGHLIADTMAVMASLDPIMGGVDK